MAEARKGGRRSRGRRVQLPTRVPEDHGEFYEARARELGIPVSSYVAMRLAQADGLNTPDYVLEELRVAEARRAATQGQQEFPMPRTA
ncbi:hypothetical protein NY551_18625 [Curtobacterium flaccumfaciens pv. oortii]|uniref:hypothetical protein n=1 Tax=Curtobacterium flaccumfaciens TaxID=2035 RepID=UPI00265A0102|nr:hypothetical protein [Curtobacterium flaccumfaciens]MCS5524754.1 hypothetical protein [Curtobacterium flaccumfaciens pv. oortii]